MRSPPGSSSAASRATPWLAAALALALALPVAQLGNVAYAGAPNGELHHVDPRMPIGTRFDDWARDHADDTREDEPPPGSEDDPGWEDDGADPDGDGYDSDYDEDGDGVADPESGTDGETGTSAGDDETDEAGAGAGDDTLTGDSGESSLTLDERLRDLTAGLVRHLLWKLLLRFRS